MAGPNIKRALEIQGWMSEDELRWLAEQATAHRFIVEVGSWKGRSTRALADNAAGMVYAVDHWQGQLLTEAPTSLDDEISERGADAIYQEFQANLAGTRASALRMNSAEAAAFVAEGTERPDMVFLDGEHAYEGVAADIAAWRPLVAPGGLLCGHDWWHEGIQKAVKEALPGYQIVRRTNIWWVTV